MSRSGRNSRDGRGGFPDPLAGFGFGGGMMRNFFGGRDPFDDPFFHRPFGSMFNNDGFPGNLFGPRHDSGFLEHRPFSPHHQESRRGPIIEELDEDHPVSSQPQEPIVEHPDDDVRSDVHCKRRGGPLVNRQQGDGLSYSFDGSSFSYGGPNGTSYFSSTERRRGPNGVVHEEHHEKDSASRTEAHRISKGIHDKGHSVTRKRNAEGREENMETLHNLAEDEVPDFEKRWESEAERNLPGWNRNRARSLGGSRTGNRQHAALPSAGSSGVRHA